MIGRIERVPLRDVWPREAPDFTGWLSDNVDQLSEATGLSLSGAEPEQTAGDFSVDLVAEDQNGNRIVIENQLEKSDHDHLGKLVTYLAALDAKAAIWIVADARPEHITAVTWLNESTAASFYLVKVEAVRIGESARAPLFTAIVGPSAEGREIGAKRKELEEGAATRKRFWEGLLAKARERTSLHASTPPNTNFWLQAPTALGGVAFTYIIRKHDREANVSIQRWDGGWNSRVFDALLQSRAEIEEEFGGELEWDRAETVAWCFIRHRMGPGGYDAEDRWPQVQDAMVDAMVRLERAFAPRIAKLAL